MELTHLDKQVEEMLKIWGEWAQGGKYSGIGWGPNLLETWLSTGGVRIERSGPIQMPDNPVAEEMEQHLIELKSEEPDNANATILYYSEYFDDKALCARKLAISIRTLEYRLMYAKKFLKGRLYDKKRSQKIRKAIARESGICLTNAIVA